MVKKINFLMLLLLITLLSICYGQELDQTLELELEQWHKIWYELDPDSYCEEVDIAQYTGEKWTSLSGDAQNQILHCRLKKWWLHTYQVKDLYKASKTAPCDVMVSEGKWSEMDALEQRFTHDCIMKRLTSSYLKATVPLLHWLPDSYLYDDSVREMVENDIFYCVVIYRQFQEDQKTDYRVFSSLKDLGWWSIVNTSHYDSESIVDDESLKKFQAKTSVKDYVGWNSGRVKSCDAHDAFRLLGKAVLDFKETDFFTIFKEYVLSERKFRTVDLLFNSYVYFSKDTE